MNLGALNMPSKWVYVIFTDGTDVNVANTDTLTRDEAIWYKKEWNMAAVGGMAHGSVVEVQLRDCENHIEKRIKV